MKMLDALSIPIKAPCLLCLLYVFVHNWEKKVFWLSALIDYP